MYTGLDNISSLGTFQITLSEEDDAPSNALKTEEKNQILREELESIGEQSFQLGFMFFSQLHHSTGINQVYSNPGML